MKKSFVIFSAALVAGVLLAEPASFKTAAEGRPAIFSGALKTEAQTVLAGADLKDIALESARLCGSWVPGGPFLSAPYFYNYDAETGKATCQMQVRCPDNCTRCVALEFAQQGEDITARILWAHYSGSWMPGVDFTQKGFGNAPVAEEIEATGYGICELSFIPAEMAGKIVREHRTAQFAPHCEKARAEIVAGVTSVDLPGAIPGPVVTFGTNTFPILCGIYSGLKFPMTAGAFYGAGRVVYIGHPGFLTPYNGTRDNMTFLANCVKWLSCGKDELKIAAIGNDSIGTLAKNLGYEVTRLQDGDDLSGYDLLMTTGVAFDFAPQVREFVKNGGSLLAAGLGWGWRFYQPNKAEASLATKYSDNQVLAPMGILMCDGYNYNQKDGGFTAELPFPYGANADEAYEVAFGKAFFDDDAERVATCTFALAVEALPPEALPEWNAKFAEVMKLPGAKKVPTPKNPLLRTDVPAKAALAIEKHFWQIAPETPCEVSPAAATYPGLVKEGTPTIDTTVAVDCSVPRWHSTGVFVPAGKPLTVKLPEEYVNLGLGVHLGTTADDLTNINANWKRAPLVTIEVPLKKSETTLYTPYGGLVYITVPEKLSRSGGELPTVNVELSGGVMAPYFKLGETSNADFLRQCEETGAPQAEIQGRFFIVTCETKIAAKVEDPQWIAEFWDKILLADQKLAGWEKREYPERICSDVQLTMGWLHNGYPLMYHIGSSSTGIDWVIDKKGLEKGQGWGPFHEIGHNHQNRDWTPPCTGEVTVNLFSCYDITNVCGISYRADGFPSSTKEQAARVAAFKKNMTYENWQKDYFLMLEVYLRIADEYGWEPYEKAFAKYRVPGFRHPTNDQERWDLFAKYMSETTNADIASVLAAWTIPVSPKMLAECADKYLPAPPELYPSPEMARTIEPAVDLEMMD